MKCQGRGVFLMYIEWAPIFWKASDTSWFFLCTVFLCFWVVYEFFILTLFVRCENYLEMPIFRRRYFWTLGSIWVSLGSTLWTLTWKSVTIQRCGRHDRMFDRTSFFPFSFATSLFGFVWICMYIYNIYIYILYILYHMYPQIHWLIIIFPVKMATGRSIIVYFILIHVHTQPTSNNYH
jgi:hypothetical protein